MDTKIQVGIIGGTGYTGAELLRLLVQHPNVELRAITSRTDKGKRIDSVFPNFIDVIPHTFLDPQTADFSACDVIFFATPNGVAMKEAPALLEKGIKVIDLSADYRIQDVGVWEKWYEMKHLSPQFIEAAVYGLPEFHRAEIQKAQLVANPGCYPTAIQLALLPLLKEKLIDTGGIIIDAKSGVSGAGRNAEIGLLFAELSDNFKAYKVDGHRHYPEIKQGLAKMAGGDVELTFVPHLTPMIRGIYATIYVKIHSGNTRKLQEYLESYYYHEPFVHVLPLGQAPEIRSVRGGNHCQLSVFQAKDSNMIIVLSVIDNLVKGAAGQAIQNMNLMFEQAETAGLSALTFLP